MIDYLKIRQEDNKIFIYILALEGYSLDPVSSAAFANGTILTVN